MEFALNRAEAADEVCHLLLYQLNALISGGGTSMPKSPTRQYPRTPKNRSTPPSFRYPPQLRLPSPKRLEIPLSIRKTLTSRLFTFECSLSIP